MLDLIAFRQCFGVRRRSLVDQAVADAITEDVRRDLPNTRFEVFTFRPGGRGPGHGAGAAPRRGAARNPGPGRHGSPHLHLGPDRPPKAAVMGWAKMRMAGGFTPILLNLKTTDIYYTYVGETCRYLLSAPKDHDPVTAVDLDKAHRQRRFNERLSPISAAEKDSDNTKDRLTESTAGAEAFDTATSQTGSSVSHLPEMAIRTLRSQSTGVAKTPEADLDFLPTTGRDDDGSFEASWGRWYDIGEETFKANPDTVIAIYMPCMMQMWEDSHNDVVRKGLPYTAAFAYTDYKVQGRTLDRVALELRGTRTTNIESQAVPSQ
ncbi:hypothetical protein GGTG_12512 [Gaeumannomyces tritici R3-111a-1]|uniref:Uncharacterized protein n=1 Tax=Gaeumannomyces tritici (strain R3-111a-1) TaxID=644352 RepID=J3PG88_GAET3|nr:hypothetical protein GGTG_12512 [Gaeumannomyces tritici R3-111a-1]EJT69628.1 hypothetical protein GGTG_12512 [Gaeumannomyces tritici R3-111a-1]